MTRTIITCDLLNFLIVTDTNNIIILFPQTVADSTFHTILDGTMLSNSGGCWDWLGWYGQNADQKGGELIGFRISFILLGHL